MTSSSPARRPTMQQIAAAAGVSVTTVSHAMSGKRPVSAATSERIRQVIAASGYLPDDHGRRLRSGRSRTIGLVVPDIAHPYFGAIARGVEQVANAHDHALIVCTTVDSDPARESRYFAMLRTRAVDGLIYTAGREHAAPSELVELVSGDAAIVVADEAISDAERVPSVVSDNAGGARAAAQHLADLGHRRIAVLGGYAGLSSTSERIAGVRDVFPDAIVLTDDFSLASGARMVDAILDPHPDVTAIVAGNDLVAIGAIGRLRDRGRDVPRDMSVVGFDDIEIAAAFTPALTTVRQDAVGIGEVAAGLLFDRLVRNDPVDGRHRRLPVELVVRETTGVPNAS